MTMYFADTLERVLFLRKVPIIGSLAPDLLAALAHQGTERSFSQGDILTAGSQESMLVIVLGEVSIEYQDHSVFHAGSHQLVGLLQALGSSPSMRVTADCDGLSLDIPRSAIRSLMDDSFAVVVHVLRETGALFARHRVARGANAPVIPLASREPISEDDDLLGRLVTLRKLRPFRAFDMDALVHFAKAMTPRVLEAGEHLWQEGDEAPYVVAVLEGELSATSECQASATSHGPGEVLGLIDGLATSPRWHTVTATSTSRIATLPIEAIFDILEDHSEASRLMLAYYLELGTTLFRDLAEHELLALAPVEARHEQLSNTKKSGPREAEPG